MANYFEYVKVGSGETRPVRDAEARADIATLEAAVETAQVAADNAAAAAAAAQGTADVAKTAAATAQATADAAKTNAANAQSKADAALPAASTANFLRVVSFDSSTGTLTTTQGVG